MSKQSLGKTLLKNVIRHTDAHNKIQEETEMWKMRGWEVQMSSHRPESARGRMHCDRVPDQSRVSEHDDREARYWSRKLYEFESNDPDRWGHSGFKELYPEEFKSDSDKSGSPKRIKHHKRKKSKSDTKAKQSKNRKKKKKKKKKDGEEKRKRANSSSSSEDSEDSDAAKDKQRRKRSKGRHKNKKTAKSRGRDEETSSGDSSEEERERRTRKKRKQDSRRDSDSEPNSKKKKKMRKDWRAAGEDSSHDTSAD